MRGIAIRAQRNPRFKGSICQFCRFSTVSEVQQRPLSLRSQAGNPPNPQWRRTFPRPLTPAHDVAKRFASTSQATRSSFDPNTALKQVTKEFQSIKNSDSVPPDEAVVQLLRKCQQIVEYFVSQDQDQQGRGNKKDEASATSSLLDLEEKAASAPRAKATGGVEQRVADSISQIANELLEDEKVFISPDALACYTKIQTLLKRADYFPRIFTLYANKPVPEPNTSPVKYRQQNPKSVKNAIPSELANMALDVAVEQKNLPLALAIIDTTFCTPAFYRAKIFKKATLPLTGLAAAPLASYALASWSATLQNTMDPGMATGIAFSAILAYIGFTSSVGIVAITTANDHMERVVWLPGIPLRQRWLREEERAALDKVAVAWGFKDPWMRGEEEGEEWESLREFIGMRGMILDKTDLMEGMQ
ncbi:hypothetical protein VTN77DRAFT_9126 [Rasamsonia byssochlamydoides]|uniref:uncharacterized protein n=1 Tax=Rasamsonia byssochlamydoides TaxID=89139 RepID=UPI003743FA8C